MLPSGVLDKFIERCPAAVMVRGTVERLLRPERLDEIFETHRSRQYEREIVCSELVYKAYQPGFGQKGVSLELVSR